MSTSMDVCLVGRRTEKATCIAGNYFKAKSNSSLVNNNSKTNNNY